MVGKNYISKVCEGKEEQKSVCGYKREAKFKDQLWTVFIFNGRPFTCNKVMLNIYDNIYVF